MKNICSLGRAEHQKNVVRAVCFASAKWGPVRGEVGELTIGGPGNGLGELTGGPGPRSAQPPGTAWPVEESRSPLPPVSAGDSPRPSCQGPADGRTPTPKKPWNDDSPVNATKQCFQNGAGVCLFAAASAGEYLEDQDPLADPKGRRLKYMGVSQNERPFFDVAWKQKITWTPTTSIGPPTFWPWFKTNGTIFG